LLNLLLCSWVIVQRVSDWLVSISDEYVKWPEGAVVEATKNKFGIKCNIPNVIGDIDCTNITIKAPTQHNNCYYDRKQNCSIVLQAVVDAYLKFTHLYCGEPGSVHDARILRKSKIYQMVCEATDCFFSNGSFLLADSAYPANSWLVTPLRDFGNLTRQEKKYNLLVNKGRSVVERTFGLLKNRFRRLNKFTEQVIYHIWQN